MQPPTNTLLPEYQLLGLSSEKIEIRLVDTHNSNFPLAEGTTDRRPPFPCRITVSLDPSPCTLPSIVYNFPDTSASSSPNAHLLMQAKRRHPKRKNAGVRSCLDIDRLLCVVAIFARSGGSPSKNKKILANRRVGRLLLRCSPSSSICGSASDTKSWLANLIRGRETNIT